MPTRTYEPIPARDVAFLLVSRIPVYSGKKMGTRVPPDMVLPVFVVVVLFFALLLSYPWEVLTLGTIAYLASLPFGGALGDEPKAKNAKVTLVYQHELPNVPGKSIKGVLVEYGPGGYSPGHTHAKSAFIYATVLEGAIRSQVNNGPVTTYEAGQSFSELPGDRHGVSANASETKPAKLLAVFVVDTNETELTIPFGN